MARIHYSESNPPRALLGLFAVIILLGAALLSLPIASPHGIGSSTRCSPPPPPSASPG